MTQEVINSISAEWWSHRHELLKEGRGLLEYRASSAPFADRDLDFRHADFEPGMRAPGFGTAMVLPLLTESLLDDDDAVRDLYRVVALATNRGCAVLAATELAEHEFAGAARSDAEPWVLDAEVLVARADLAFLLERYCAARARQVGTPSALYLTPIEARLARALEKLELTFRPQVQI